MRPIPATVLAAALGICLGMGIGAAGGAPGAPDRPPATAPVQPPVAAPEPSWQDLNHSAKLAHDAKDYPTYRARVGRLYDLLSGHPDTVFGMAKAEALLGHTAAALEWLDVYASMGLVRDVSDQPDLASLLKADGYAAVLARLEANKRPRSSSVRAFTLPDPDLLTEDIAYDPGTGRFFVSSVREAKIVTIGKGGGAASDFVPPGRDAIWGVLALAVDARRGVLWATTAAMPQTRGYREADQGHTAVLRYDLATGKLQKRYDLPLPPAPLPAPKGSAAGGPPPAEERLRVLGDMTVAPNGDVFVSEAVTGAVYTVGHARDELETLVAPGTFISPQTPAVTPDGRRLLVADYVRGIGIVDLATRATTWMTHPKGVAVNGIDGLYLHGDSLLAVQNGTEPNRVIRLFLDRTLTRILRWEPLDSHSPGLGAPTHGTVVGRDFFYLANSGWDQLADDGSVKPGAALTPAEVRRAPL
jgi:sugar lactone lactonase YvrE